MITNIIPSTHSGSKPTASTPHRNAADDVPLVSEEQMFAAMGRKLAAANARIAELEAGERTARAAEAPARDALALRLAANSAVPVDANILKTFSLHDLQAIEQAQIANAATAKQRKEREAWAGYDLNAHIDAANAASGTPAQQSGDDWANYNLNAIIDAAKG